MQKLIETLRARDAGKSGAMAAVPDTPAGAETLGGSSAALERITPTVLIDRLLARTNREACAHVA